ncbi:MAG: MotA/TolQ/ExbB proton channel family protein [Oscillospiraceae bacterium]|nr:MotA/TolQ/ExbB proton channel family protein [Oscillospiraceae bacterium]
MGAFFSDPIVWLIILMACVNAAIWFLSFRAARSLKSDLHIVIREANPSKRHSQPRTEEEEFAYEDKLLEQQKWMNTFYAFFANLTACFPLMGMFGTVLALVKMAGNLAQSNVPVELFFSALNTTLAGLIAAMLFKGLLDPYLSVLIDRNNKEVDTYIERNTEKRQEAKQA